MNLTMEQWLTIYEKNIGKFKGIQNVKSNTCMIFTCIKKNSNFFLRRLGVLETFLYV